MQRRGRPGAGAGAGRAAAGNTKKRAPPPTASTPPRPLLKPALVLKTLTTRRQPPTVTMRSPASEPASAGSATRPTGATRGHRPAVEGKAVQMERSLAVVDVHRSGQFQLADRKIRPEPFPRWMPQGAAELAVFHISGQLGVNPTRVRGNVWGNVPRTVMRCAATALRPW